MRGRSAEARGFRGRGEFRQGRENAEREHAARRAALECALDEGENLFLQNLATAGEPLLDGVFREVERGGDVFDGAVFAIVENEWLAVIFRHALERAPHEGLFLLVCGNIRRGLIVGWKEVGGVIDRLGVADGLASIGAAQAADFETQNSAEPRAEFFGFAQSGELAPRIDERVLGEVLALTQLPRRGIGEGAKQTLITFDDLAESAAIACERGGDEFCVGGSDDGSHGIGRVHVMECFYVPGKREEVTRNPDPRLENWRVTGDRGGIIALPATVEKSFLGRLVTGRAGLGTHGRTHV